MISTRLGLRAAPLARTAFAPRAAQPARVQQALGRRGYAHDKDGNASGKSKLAFRFGLQDVPVELYPMFVVVALACGGAAFAVGRHFYKDSDLRLVPTSLRKKVTSDEQKH